MSNKPVGSFRIGNVEATMWRNKNGEKEYISVTVTRSYKDGDEWKESVSFGHADLLNLAKVAERAESYIANLE